MPEPELETESNCMCCSSRILSLAKLLDNSEPANTPCPETPISDLGPDPASVAVRGIPPCTEVDFPLCHKIRALKHYAHWPYRQIATATGVALSTVYRIAHPPLTPIRSRLRGRHSILRTTQRERLIVLATSSAENRRKSYTEIAQMAGITACSRTLRRTISSAGYHRRIARKKPYLSSKTRQVRALFLYIQVLSLVLYPPGTHRLEKRKRKRPALPAGAIAWFYPEI